MISILLNLFALSVPTFYSGYDFPYIDDFTRGPLVLYDNLSLICHCLNCEMMNARIFWTKDGKVLEDSPLYEFGNNSLIFPEKSPQLEGEYQCFAETNQSLSSIPPIHVHFFVEDDYTFHEVVEGQQALVQCKESSLGIPHFHKIRMEENLSSKDSVRKLDRGIFISSVEKSFNGFLKCYADFEAPKVSILTETIVLFVKFSQKNQNIKNISEIVFPPNDNYVFKIRRSDYRDINCVATGNPIPAVEIKKISESSNCDLCSYYCQATNSLGKSAKRFFKIQFIDTPTATPSPFSPNVTDGETVILKLLKVEGSPPPRIKWFYGDEMRQVGEMIDKFHTENAKIVKMAENIVKVTFDKKMGPRRLIAVIYNKYDSSYLDMTFFVSSVPSQTASEKFLRNNQTVIIFLIIFLVLLVITVVAVVVIGRWKSRRDRGEKAKANGSQVNGKLENETNFSLLVESNGMFPNSVPIRGRAEPSSIVI